MIWWLHITFKFNSCPCQLPSESHWYHGPNSDFQKPSRALSSVHFREKTPQRSHTSPGTLSSQLQWSKGSSESSTWTLPSLSSHPHLPFPFYREHLICKLSSFVSLGREEPVLTPVFASVSWSQSWLHRTAVRLLSAKAGAGWVLSLC